MEALDSTQRTGRLGTQNSGVVTDVEFLSYYGKINDMIELDYFGSFKVVLFKGDLVEVHNAGGIKSEMGVPSFKFHH